MASDKLGPFASRLLATVRSAEPWLGELGLVEESLHCLRSRFSMSYRSSSAVVTISVNRGTGEFFVSVGPAGEEGHRRVSLNAILAVRDLPLVETSLWAPIDEQVAIVQAGMDGLRLLSAMELAGDWSRLHDAEAFVRDAVEQRRVELSDQPGPDPGISAILRAQLPRHDDGD